MQNPDKRRSVRLINSQTDPCVESNVIRSQKTSRNTQVKSGLFNRSKLDIKFTKVNKPVADTGKEPLFRLNLLSHKDKSQKTSTLNSNTDDISSDPVNVESFLPSPDHLAELKTKLRDEGLQTQRNSSLNYDDTLSTNSPQSHKSLRYPLRNVTSLSPVTFDLPSRSKRSSIVSNKTAANCESELGKIAEKKANSQNSMTCSQKHAFVDDFSQEIVSSLETSDVYDFTSSTNNYKRSAKTNKKKEINSSQRIRTSKITPMKKNTQIGVIPLDSDVNSVKQLSKDISSRKKSTLPKSKRINNCDDLSELTKKCKTNATKDIGQNFSNGTADIFDLSQQITSTSLVTNSQSQNILNPDTMNFTQDFLNDIMTSPRKTNRKVNNSVDNFIPLKEPLKKVSRKKPCTPKPKKTSQSKALSELTNKLSKNCRINESIQTEIDDFLLNTSQEMRTFDRSKISTFLTNTQSQKSLNFDDSVNFSSKSVKKTKVKETPKNTSQRIVDPPKSRRTRNSKVLPEPANKHLKKSRSTTSTKETSMSTNNSQNCSDQNSHTSMVTTTESQMSLNSSNSINFSQNFLNGANQNGYRNSTRRSLLYQIESMNHGINEAEIQELCYLFSCLKISDKINSMKPSFLIYRDPCRKEVFNCRNLCRVEKSYAKKKDKIFQKLRDTVFRCDTFTKNRVFPEKVKNLPCLPVPEKSRRKSNFFQSDKATTYEEIAQDINLSAKSVFNKITKIDIKAPHYFYAQGEYNFDGFDDWHRNDV